MASQPPPLRSYKAYEKDPTFETTSSMGQKAEGVVGYDLEYADDTLLLSLTTTQLQRILTALEAQAKKYGMHLNLPKTELLVDPRRDKLE